MKKLYSLFSIILFVTLTSFKTDDVPIEFKNQLERANMTFEMPKGFTETKPIINRQMNYEFAIKHTEKQFEVRFALRPLDVLIRDFNELEKKKKPGDININPNKFYSSILQATLLNISGGKVAQFAEFPKTAVKTEFNADWGATASMEVGKEFGQDYKYCLVVAIHKDNAADAYYFYLSDKQETIQELMEPVFRSLKFK